MLKLAGYKVNTEGDEIESCDHAFTVIEAECAGNRDVKYRLQSSFSEWKSRHDSFKISQRYFSQEDTTVTNYKEQSHSLKITR